jgi:hypothetical protein
MTLETNGADPASLDDGLQLTLTLTLGGSPFVQNFGTLGAGVKRITIDGRDGPDTIRIDQALAAPDTAHPLSCGLVCLDIIGGSGSDTLYGPILGTNWTIDGAGSGSADGITSFAGFENLVGGSDVVHGTASDEFRLVGTGSISTIDGGAGLDTLVGPDQANTWLVTGADAGTINGATGWAHVENLTGGTSTDLFEIGAGGSVTGVIDGGIDVPTAPGNATPPVDTLSYALVSTPVAVNLALLSAVGVAAFTGIDEIVGGMGIDDTFVGPGVSGDHVSWRVTGANAGEVDGLLTGNDDITTTTFSGFENRSRFPPRPARRGHGPGHDRRTRRLRRRHDDALRADVNLGHDDDQPPPDPLRRSGADAAGSGNAGLQGDQRVGVRRHDRDRGRP